MAGPERAETRELLKYWKKFRGAKRLPDREDIHMEELTALLPRLFILDIESDDRYVLKMLGEAIIERLGGHDLTGINILELFQPAFRERLTARIQLIFEFGYAACTHTRVPASDGIAKRTENLMLPVGNAGGGCRQIFGSLYYTEGKDDVTHIVATAGGLQILDESFIDLGSGYAAVIDASELPPGIFPGAFKEQT